MHANARRYVPLPQLRGGMGFCTRVGVLNFSFRYKVVVVCKNHDAKVGEPRVSGASPNQAEQICRGGYKVVLVWKAVAYTDLLCPGAFTYWSNVKMKIPPSVSVHFIKISFGQPFRKSILVVMVLSQPSLLLFVKTSCPFSILSGKSDIVFK